MIQKTIYCLCFVCIECLGSSQCSLCHVIIIVYDTHKHKLFKVFFFFMFEFMRMNEWMRSPKWKTDTISIYNIHIYNSHCSTNKWYPSTTLREKKDRSVANAVQTWNFIVEIVKQFEIRITRICVWYGFVYRFAPWIRELIEANVYECSMLAWCSFHCCYLLQCIFKSFVLVFIV